MSAVARDPPVGAGGRLESLLGYERFCDVLKVKHREGGGLVPYRPKPIQWQLYETIRDTRGLCKLIILKSRRLGVTTALASIIFHRVMTRPALRALIVAHRGADAETIFGIYDRFHLNLPQSFRFPREGSRRKRLSIPALDSSIEVVSAIAESSGRGGDAQLLHLSEFSHYPAGDAFLSAILPTLPLTGSGLLAIESTANAAGDFFHDLWVKSESGQSGYKAIFYPWFADEDFRLPTDVPRGTFTEEEQMLNEIHGVDGHQIAWLREAERVICFGNQDIRRREFPSVPHEAFQSARLAVWSLSVLDASFSPCEVTHATVTEKEVSVGREGNCIICRAPEAGRDYIIGADPAGGSVEGDWCAASVWTADRRYGEWPRQVAELAVHVDPILFAGLLAALGRYYNTAVIACEITGVGRGTQAALQRVYSYPRLHRQAPFTKSLSSSPSTYSWGFETTRASKEVLISIFDWLLQARRVRFFSRALYEELCSFLHLPDGKYEGRPYDDRVMASLLAVASWFQHNFPGLPLSEVRGSLATIYDESQEADDVEETDIDKRRKVRRMFDRYERIVG